MYRCEVWKLAPALKKTLETRSIYATGIVKENLLSANENPFSLMFAKRPHPNVAENTYNIHPTVWEAITSVCRFLLPLCRFL